MVFRCQECGHIFEEGEQSNWTEPYGERMSGCPLCDSPYEEAHMCRVCNEYSKVNSNGVCTECYEELIKKSKDFFSKLNDEEKEIVFDILEAL